MKELKITLRILEIELIPTFKKDKRSILFNWFGFTIYILLSK